MKKVKIILLMLVTITTLMFAGCSATNNIKITEEGQGRQEIKFAIDKSTYNEEYMKVSNIEDIAKILKDNIANENIVITTDSKSSTSKDYIIASIEYNSLEEMDNIIKNMGLELNSFEIDSEVEDTDVDVDIENEEEETYITVLKEYFSANGIAYDVDFEGFKKFVKAFEKAMDLDYDEDLDFEGFELDSELDNMFSMFTDEEELFAEEDYLKTMIVKNANSSQLKIGAGTIQVLPLYIMATLVNNTDSIVDLDKMLDVSFDEIYQEVIADEKKEYMEILKAVELEKLIKDAINVDEMEENTCTIDNITEEQLKIIFTEEVVNTMNEIYYGEDDIEDDYVDEEYLDEDDYNYMDEDLIDMELEDLEEDSYGILEEIIDVYKCTIEYGKQKVLLGIDDLEGNDEGYIIIDSEKGLISNTINMSNKMLDVDDTPKTGDRMNLVGFCSMIMIATIGTVYFYKRRLG